MWLDLNGIISPAHCSALGPEHPKAQPAVTRRITGGKGRREGREERGGMGKQTYEQIKQPCDDNKAKCGSVLH